MFAITGQVRDTLGELIPTRWRHMVIAHPEATNILALGIHYS